MLAVSPTGTISLAVLTFILALATYFDLKSSRIPNLLILFGLATGLFLQGSILGSQGLGQGIAASLVVFTLLLPAYAFGVTGAGDVKLMTVVGLFLGTPINSALLLITTILAGGICGLLLIFIRKDVGVFISRYCNMSKFMIVTGSVSYIPPSKNEVASTKFPYALAISIGTYAAAYLILNCSQAYKGILA